MTEQTTKLTIEQAGAPAPLVTLDEAVARVDAGAVLIDVRSDAGRAAGGVLSGATVVAKDQLDERFALDSPDRVTEVESADTPIVIVCGSVRGSGPVAAELIRRGFTDVVHVEGGFPAWKTLSAGLADDYLGQEAADVPEPGQRVRGTLGRRHGGAAVHRHAGVPHPVAAVAARAGVRGQGGFRAEVLTVRATGHQGHRPPTGSGETCPRPTQAVRADHRRDAVGGCAVAFYLGAPTVSWVLVGMITVAATLESVVGFCLGCAIFGRLQAIGLIPASVCEACNDIRLRQQRAATVG